MSEVLRVSRYGFYAWRARSASARQAIVDTVEFVLHKQRSVAAGVTFLSATLALAGTTSRPVGTSRTIRGLWP